MSRLFALIACVACFLVACASPDARQSDGAHALFIPGSELVAGGGGTRPEDPKGDTTTVAGGGGERPTKISVHGAVLEALTYNWQILIAREQETIAKYGADEAKSFMLPSLTGGVRYDRLATQTSAVFAPPDSGIETTFPTSPIDQFNAEIRADFPVFASGRYLYSYRSAKLSAQGASQDRAATEMDVAELVTSAAYDLQLTIALVEVALENELAFERQVKDSRSQFDAGRVTKEAVLEAEVEHLNAVRIRERQESLVPIQAMVLNRFLGRESDAPIEIVDEPINEQPTWDEANVLETALAGRPEINSARLGLEAAEKNSKAVWGGEAPELRGSFGWTATDNDFQNPKDNGFFGLNLEIPLYRGGGSRARIRSAKRRIEQARIRLRDVEAEVHNEVSLVFREVNEEYKDIRVAERSVELQTEALRIQRRKFENGRATSRDVLTSTSVLTEAKVAAVSALYDYNVALMKLHRVRGADPRDAPQAKP